jgi:CubicO group peptidase (beta-lactamase class C family)
MPEMSIPLRVAFAVIVGAWLSAPLSLSLANEQPCGVPKPGVDDWRIEAQTAVNIDPKPLCALIDNLEALKPNIHSVLVVRHGSLVFEHYRRGVDQRWGSDLGEVTYGPDVKHDVRSISKSVVSLLIGIALDRKLIANIDQTVLSFLPQYASLRTPAKERISLRHLLTMSSGIAWNENIPYTDAQNSERRMIDAPDPYRYVLEQPLMGEPGKVWNYSGGSTALLAAVLQRTSGKWVVKFARDELFTPLGITDLEWAQMPGSGEFAAAYGLRLRPRDMAKLGQLVISNGIWKGKPIVSPEWLKEVTMRRFPVEYNLYYGYQWWISSSSVNGKKIDWFEALGLGGQRIIIVPSLELVVVFTTGLYDAREGWLATTRLRDDYVLPAAVGP